MWKVILEASFTGLFAYGLIKDPRDPIWRKMIFVVMLMGIIHMVFPFPMHLLLDGMALFFFLLFARHQTFGNALMSAMIPCAILAISDTTVLLFFKAFIFDGLSYLEIRENHGMILDFCMLQEKRYHWRFSVPWQERSMISWLIMSAISYLASWQRCIIWLPVSGQVQIFPNIKI